MKKIGLRVKHDDVLGELSHNVFSSFIEHIGRAVYNGIYQPAHASADEDGFRRDVMELVRELNVPYVRYPGGNFVSGYNWKNGIGEKSKRPLLPDIAWKQNEPNQVGVDEFMRWAEKVGAQPIMAVNMGTGTPQEALELLQYCNGTSGYWAEKRKENGHAEPYSIKYWCIGNEMDGEWQIGHKTAEEYAAIAGETARLMKLYDPSVKLIFCGSSTFDMPTFPEWDCTIVDKCFPYIDYISCHNYFSYDRKEENIPAFMNSCRALDKGLSAVETTVEYVKVKRRCDKDIFISLDEFNVWYKGDGSDWNNVWTIAPCREETVYSSLDATVLASLYAVIFNHCKNVKIACLAQLVNVIAPILTANDGGAIRQTIFYPYKYLSQLAKGKVFGYKTDGEDSIYASAMSDGKEGILLLCNLTGEIVEPNIQWDGFGQMEAVEQIFMNGDPNVKNTVENPDSALPKTVRLSPDKSIKLGAYSWNIILYKKI